MQIKVSLRYHLTPAQISTIKWTKITKVDEDAETEHCCVLLERMWNSIAIMENSVATCQYYRRPRKDTYRTKGLCWSQFQIFQFIDIWFCFSCACGEAELSWWETHCSVGILLISCRPGRRKREQTDTHTHTHTHKGSKVKT
jgi:hypothetical protein